MYVPYGPDFVFSGPNDWFPAPASLKEGNRYYTRSKPQYEDKLASMFISARSFGAKGDGGTDDTAALTYFFAYLSQNFGQGVVGFVDAGYYKVTDTIYIPPNTRIVGEGLASVILGSGPKFSNTDDPRPVVQVGKQLLDTILNPSRRNLSHLWPVSQTNCHPAGFETDYGHVVTLPSPICVKLPPRSFDN